MLLGVLLYLLVSSDVLVLKNGKKMVCDSYTVEGEQVTVARNGQNYVLPESLVNWTATKAAAKKNSRTKPSEPKKIKSLEDLAAERPQKQVALTNEVYHRLQESGFQLASLVDNFGEGDHIVKVFVNRRGPFLFLLDPESERSMMEIKPALSAGLGYRTSKLKSGFYESITQDILVGNGLIQKFKMLVGDLPNSGSRKIDGILGRDHLDQFIVGHPHPHKVSFVPNGQGQYTVLDLFLEDEGRATQQIADQLEESTLKLGKIRDDFMNRDVNVKESRQRFEALVPEMANGLLDLRCRIYAFRSLDYHRMPQEGQAVLLDLFKCMEKFDDFLDGQDQLIEAIRVELNQEDRSGRSASLFREQARIAEELLSCTGGNSKTGPTVEIATSSRGGGSLSGEVTVSFSKIGNSIIVQARLNDRGPYRFLLDTGASATVLSPSVSRQLRLKGEGVVPISGVGDRTIMAEQTTLASVDMGGAYVAYLPVIIHEIPSLNVMGVEGLLGQDFLNHFVVTVDSSKHIITLKAH